jgi:type I restriction enzyme R subunit
MKELASLLEEKPNIPMVHEQLDLILDLQTDKWWQDATVPMLEGVRKRLRGLINLIDKQRRRPIYTDFADEMGDEGAVELPGFAPADGFERFRAKARAFLREHEDDLVIHKLHTNKSLTQSDLEHLERLLASNGVGDAADLDRAKEESEGRGLFVRSLVGLDREAAKQAFASFLKERTLTANQIEFIDMIVNRRYARDGDSSGR